MDRRTLLSTATAAAVTAVAGCLREGDDIDSPPDGDSETPTESSTELPTETPSPERTRIVGESLENSGVQCGNEFGSNSSAIENGVVTVEGVIGGNNSCYRARLASVEYDDTDDELHVVVESFSDADPEEVCQTCIVEIATLLESSSRGQSPVRSASSTTASNSYRGSAFSPYLGTPSST